MDNSTFRQARRSIEAHSLTVKQRLLVMALNAIPFLHALAIGIVACAPWTNWPQRIFMAMAVLYLLPAILARMVIMMFPIQHGAISLGTADFFKWWALLNLQIIFCRFPFFDEFLRLFPSAYSAWLRLWGSKIGRLVYWSPETRILDRSFLHIGDDVIFGAGVKLNPHVMIRNDNGQMELLLAPVKIGDRAIIGGYSLLTAGSEIPSDECSRAYLISPPFTKWQDGRRAKE
ncbi:MAG: hypothetical protein A2X46_06500 [Lentisphaerae bacterium GWF2_57_35]|nr:MAG: hypothetical protein A2X46_06500 [Lentisphaerae bacterium GWF2_57_35]